MMQEQEPKKGIAAIILGKREEESNDSSGADLQEATEDAGRRMMSAFKGDDPKEFMDALNDYLDMRE
jgi:hypothetical protein